MGTNEKRRRSTRHQIILVLLFVLAAVLAARYALIKSSEANLLALHFENVDGSKSQIFKLDVARSEAERHKGLMFVKPGELAPNRGMIFVYPEDSDHKMWMRNTYLSLDMLFLNTDNKVVGVLEHVPILNEEIRGVSQPSRYVIELNAGTIKRNKISVGSVARYAGTLSAGS